MRRTPVPIAGRSYPRIVPSSSLFHAISPHPHPTIFIPIFVPIRYIPCMYTNARPIILASASPRRHKILADAGIHCEVVVPEVEEEMILDDPRATVLTNVHHKADWALQRSPGRVIVVADTVVSFRGRCLTKPSSLDDARRMLRMLSGHDHAVLTAVGVVDAYGNVRTSVVTTDVRFKILDGSDVDDYFRRVDPMDKAGAYNIDQHGDLLIVDVNGSYTNVMGLPVETLRKMLSKPGYLLGANP